MDDTKVEKVWMNVNSLSRSKRYKIRLLRAFHQVISMALNPIIIVQQKRGSKIKEVRTYIPL